MNRNITQLHLARLRRCVVTAFPKAWKTTLWLLKIMLPVSLAVTLLQYFGVLDYLAQFVDPIFRGMGLPGCTAVAFITGASLTTYAGIAVLTTMALTLRQATILSLMILVCHALPMECAVTHRTGSSFWGIVTLRIVMAFAAAFYLNLVLPEMSEPFGFGAAHEADALLTDVLLTWTLSSVRISLMILGIIYGLMILQQGLAAYRLLGVISKPLRPIMRLFGLPENTAYFWLVGNIIGLAYGGAVMNDCLEEGRVSRQEAAEVNRHLAINHSLVEDTLVFAAIGIGAWWIVSTRVLFAMITVWGRRLLIHLADTLAHHRHTAARG